MRSYSIALRGSLYHALKTHHWGFGYLRRISASWPSPTEYSAGTWRRTVRAVDEEALLRNTHRTKQDSERNSSSCYCFWQKQDLHELFATAARFRPWRLRSVQGSFCVLVRQAPRQRQCTHTIYFSVYRPEMQSETIQNDFAKGRNTHLGRI